MKMNNLFPVRIKLTGKNYDLEQTAACDRLRERLQSIAVMAVQAQDAGSPDTVADLLEDIERDLIAAQRVNNVIATDEFFEVLSREEWEQEMRGEVATVYDACSDGFDMETASKATFVDIILDQLGCHGDNSFRSLRILETFRAMPKTWQRKFIADCQ